MKSNREVGKNGLFACPCCGFATLREAGCYEICPLCFWEDDGQDDPDAAENHGGPNYVSLVEARINFIKFGASDIKNKEHVRRPSAEDINMRQYKLVNGEPVMSNHDNALK